ncbi:TonB-dependent receptor [Pontibacter sp. Tf4]|uniref:TonB-dependent receptor domain-containing protein n=1 Tax=Pontibacter sp. Tf4 TaxID=2761620 RepID=UPI00162A7DE5|nr:TonB-dependent receptor [Pontibacter sp. Tf4]MBB6613105.1 TonB-dependent receptor [Pontibacter sp. Tf4]
MKKTILLYICTCLFTTIAAAQTIVTGTITNAHTQQPIVGATIKASTGQVTQSTLNGSYSLPVPMQATYLVVSHISFVTDTIAIAPEQTTNYNIQLQPRPMVLPEVSVQGYQTNRPLLETAGAISIINSDVLQQTDESSLVRAINTVPGVQMEERAPASYRISVRGSTLRSPYGIRNVKLYYNGIPLTEANGTTALNLLDAASVGSVEVLKGPAGSLYGAGTGGAILLEPDRAELGREAGIGVTVGSFGFRKYSAVAGVGSAKSNVLVQYNQQEYDGFREQSAMNRKVLLISPEFYLSEKQTITSHLIYSDLYYELPGGLTLEQYNQNPNQARGGDFGSVKQNASMNQESFLIGLKHNYSFNDNWSNATLVYGMQRFRDHPFNTDYERNASQEVGARSSFAHNTTIATIATTFTFGGEFQRSLEVARTYDNNSGTAGNLRSDDEITARTGFVFGQAELELPSDFILTLALSLNDTQYKTKRLAQVTTGNYSFVKDFETVLSPRIALLKKLNDQVSVHGSISSGFSPPTEEEILTSDGVFNNDLEPERGTNYELGVRGYALQRKLYVDVVGFYFRLNETIVSRQSTSGVAVFRNVGATSQKGLETALSYTIVDAPASWISYSKLWASYTYSHFRFKEYQQNTDNYSGNRLTGVAPHVLSAGFDIRTRPGFYLHLRANYTDAIPLNDANTVYAESYLVTGAKLGLRRTIASALQLDVFAGIDNLTDENYSLGNDLNAFGGRYYQPAPPRNYYTGIKLNYKLR